MNKLDTQFKFAIDYLVNNIDEFNDFEIDEIFEVNSDKEVTIYLPYDYEEHDLTLSKKDIIEQVEKFKDYKLNSEKNRISIKDEIFYIVGFSNIPEKFIQDEIVIRSSLNKLSAILSYENKLLSGLIALKENAYHKDYHSPYSYYPFLTITYDEANAKISETKEIDLISSLRFELLSNHDIHFDLGEFDDDWDFDYEDEEFTDDTKKQLRLKPLLQYDEGIKMYLVTESIYDREFKFLSLYKILEHYSSVALRVDVLEGLTKKLDSPKSLNPDSKYLNSIIELASSFELRKRDKELIRNVLSRCVDILDLAELYTPFIKEKVSDINLKYGSKKNDIDKVSIKIADILYSTRNHLAHAKANYSLSGFECPIEELDELNELTKQVALRTIKWYARLPKHLK